MCAFGIDGQYKMSVTIDKFEDFLTDDKFISFILIENIGLSLPYWELKFDCVYPELLRYLNELQTITIQLGTSTKDLTPFNLIIKKPIVIPQSTQSYSVTLRGFTFMHSYLTTEHIQIYENKSSKDLANIIANKYSLTFKSNIQNTNDIMTYYQPNVSDYKLLFTEWLHSYYDDNDLIIPTINIKNELTYNSIKQQIAEFDTETDLTFTDSTANADNEYQIDANQTGESNTTLSNYFGNYVKERDIFNVETGILTNVNVENKTPIISESKTNSVDSSISRSSGFYIQSSNVHANYYKQELINTQKYFNLQSMKQWTSVSDALLLKYSAGDLALYMAKQMNGQVNDQLSGLYLINKKVISIKNRKVHTNFLLTRENMNYSK